MTPLGVRVDIEVTIPVEPLEVMELLDPFKLKICRQCVERIGSKKIADDSPQLYGGRESNFNEGLNCNSNAVLSSVGQICQFLV